MSQSSVLLIILLLISLHLLQTYSQHNLSFQQRILLGMSQEWMHTSYQPIDSWNPSSSPCNWTHIRCIDDMVTGLSLSQQGIVGPIPLSICELKYLVRIDLSDNRLWGNIPACLHNCSNLQHLNLSWNQLSQTIPGELFFMGSLVSLSLRRNGSSLESLDLSHNHLNGFIPDGIVYQCNLSHLDLSMNEFSGEIPGDLFLMESLVILSLRGNKFHGNIPATIEKASSLERLDLSNNYLNGSIPNGIAYLSGLLHLNLSVNSLSGEIPSELFLMECLVILSLWGNRFHGNIPATIEKASSLERLDLSNNYMNGSIPNGIAYLNGLLHLNLSVNSLSGEIPGELFLMECLVSLSLWGNKFRGNLPTTIENASSLESLDLSNNHLNGLIPDGIAYQSNLSRLDLSRNEFIGEIPGGLFLMESLVILSLMGNRLHGNIPMTIEKASSLERLDLSYNYLNGSITDGIVYPCNLSYLDLSINEFSGEIPGAVFLLENLVSLCLSGNRLYGNIPATVENASCLENLNLSNNSLCGSIPDSITYLYNLSYLDLSRNSFSGEIPTRLFNTRRLGITTDRNSYYLDLSDNQLSGEIADFILNSEYGNEINLCGNEFSGMVPDLFVDEFFPYECLDPSKICYVKSTNKSLPRCSSSWCSHYKYRGQEMCSAYHKMSHNSIILIAVGIAAGLGVGFAVLYYMTRKYNVVLQSNTSMKEEEKWKVISFQGLKFETTDILPCLTDENLIGNGGSGKVYRVLINQTSSYVAVKSISISKVSDHQAEKEFLAEIQTLGAVWHYNIIKLLCYISGPELMLLVYEYCENKSLDRWLHGNASVTKLDWQTRLNIAIGAAQGLCYMHHHCPIPIIHRDIKSSNILLDSDFNAKIADFGLAKLINRCGHTETASVVAGTFGYIAPEYAYTSRVNAKSDVYSFGVVLLELTTGRKAVTRGDHLNLGGWAHLQCKDTISTIDALDEEFKEATVYLDEVISVFRLGVVCTAALASSRPSMKDCLHILMKCSNKCSSSSAVA